MLQRDKQLHFIAGITISLVRGMLFGPLLGLGAAVVTGSSKELYDLSGRGNPEWADLWFTIGGGIVGALIVCLALP